MRMRGLDRLIILLFFPGSLLFLISCSKLEPKTSGTNFPNSFPSNNQKEFQWANEVILQAHPVVRWTHPIQVSAFYADSTQKQVLESVVEQLNHVLSETAMRLTLTSDFNTSADTRVYYGTIPELTQYAKQSNFPYDSTEPGFFWKKWNKSFEITSSFVMFDTSRLAGKELARITLKEMFQQLGMGADSSLFSDSIVYENGNDKGSVYTLGQRDVKLANFLYLHLNPGTDAKYFEELFNQYWPQD